MSAPRIIGFASLLVAATTAHAGSTAGVVPVKAVVTAACSIRTQTLDFGENPAVGTFFRNQVSVDCPARPFRLAVDAGRSFRDGHRMMINGEGGSFISYDLYSAPTSDAAQVGDKGFAETYPADPISNVGTVSLDLWGRVRSGSSLAGEYTDELTLTIYY